MSAATRQATLGKQPIEHLAELYAVVAGLAVTTAIERALFADDAGLTWVLSDSLTGIAFLATLIPFVHGALAYLHRVHSVAPRTTKERGRVVWDFTLMFVEAVILLIAARSVHDAGSTALALAALWVVDIVWIGGGSVFETPRPTFNVWEQPDRLPWLTLNVPALVAAIAVWRLGAVGVVAAGLLLGVCLIRTALDYSLGWSNYFPVEPR